MRHTDINALLEADACLSWLTSETRKLIKKGPVETDNFVLRLLFLTAAYEKLPESAKMDSKGRCLLVSEVTELHYIESGKFPDSMLLDRLSTWILTAEIPADVLSDRQLRRRVNDKEVLFHTPQYNNYAMELDGNRYVKPKPNMDGEDSQRVKVSLPSDCADMRMYNGPLDKFLTEDYLKEAA